MTNHHEYLLMENERSPLIRWCGTDNAPPVVLEAKTLFNATIVGIESADEKLHSFPLPSRRTQKKSPARRLTSFAELIGDRFSRSSASAATQWTTRKISRRIFF